jgi:hypothetical protein
VSSSSSVLTNGCGIAPLEIWVQAIQLSSYRAGVARLLGYDAFASPCFTGMRLSPLPFGIRSAVHPKNLLPVLSVSDGIQ